MDAKRVVRFLTPGVCISVTSVICSAACGGFSETRGVSPLQPPSWVFSVVWPLLYLTTGAAWALWERRAAGICSRSMLHVAASSFVWKSHKVARFHSTLHVRIHGVGCRGKHGGNTSLVHDATCSVAHVCKRT